MGRKIAWADVEVRTQNHWAIPRITRALHGNYFGFTNSLDAPPTHVAWRSPGICPLHRLWPFFALKHFCTNSATFSHKYTRWMYQICDVFKYHFITLSARAESKTRRHSIPFNCTYYLGEFQMFLSQVQILNKMHHIDSHKGSYALFMRG